MNSITFTLSPNSYHSFSTPPVGCEEPLLIEACLQKLFEMWQKNYHGYLFLNSPGGCEKPHKLAEVNAWLTSNASIWAPVVEWQSHARDKIELFDGRHTLTALRNFGYHQIHIAVRASNAKRLSRLFACDLAPRSIGSP